jgi:hypothetical protein
VLAPNALLRSVVTALAQPNAAERLAASKVPSAAPDDDIDVEAAPTLLQLDDSP